MRALFDGELPIELSLKGARWTEVVDDLGRNLSDRQAIAEKDSLTETIEMQREIETLRNILEEVAGYDGRHGNE